MRRTVCGALLPGRWRVAVAVVAVVSAVGVLALGWWYGGERSAGTLDSVLGDPLVGFGEEYEDLLWPVTGLGTAKGLLLGVVVLAVAAVATRRRRALALAVLGPALSVGLSALVLKPLVGRTHYGDLALPSGHATSVTSMAWVLVLGFVAGGVPRARWLRAVLVVLAVLAVVGVSGAMVALERHYATDTVAGVLVATAVVGGLAVLLDRWPRRSLAGRFR
ncbi:phosphatase PAP2 family protein [Pseudonocardia acaciae]|uniref:phosphatase PAP2 family protein n=1 Tax=Pseudonocardia acaciae TaxID=551276 RepID=UPI001FDF0DC5|nr:phosphatase PAP2 family protein [Pseudonocardia acaciae]